jgi:hypothetical protein
MTPEERKNLAAGIALTINAGTDPQKPALYQARSWQGNDTRVIVTRKRRAVAQDVGWIEIGINGDRDYTNIDKADRSKVRQIVENAIEILKVPDNRMFELLDAEGFAVLGPMSIRHAYITAYGALEEGQPKVQDLLPGDTTRKTYALSGQTPTTYTIKRIA